MMTCKALVIWAPASLRPHFISLIPSFAKIYPHWPYVSFFPPLFDIFHFNYVCI